MKRKNVYSSSNPVFRVSEIFVRAAFAILLMQPCVMASNEQEPTLKQSIGAGEQTFVAFLNPVSPTNVLDRTRAESAFAVSDDIVQFRISINREISVTEALLEWSGGSLPLDLTNRFRTIHSPGPWPCGYDGATLYRGQFLAPPQFTSESRNGRVTLTIQQAQGTSLTGFLRSPPIVRLHSIGFTTDELRIQIIGPPGGEVGLEASTDLFNWTRCIKPTQTPFGDSTVTVMLDRDGNGIAKFVAPDLQSFPLQFFRLRLTGIGPVN